MTEIPIRSDGKAGNRALVLFSGGQDSSACLAWALDNFSEVETLVFDYGQRHIVELKTRATLLKKLKNAFPDWAAKIGQDHLLPLPALATISETALTRQTEITLNESGLPSTFVPGRNLLFFTYAAALGYRRGITNIIGGMCETDFSGYPDCRKDTLDALKHTIDLGMDREFVLHMPLMNITKAHTWNLCEQLGGETLVDIIREYSHSCYLGDHETNHIWGYGCGQCPACELREKGYSIYLQSKSENGMSSTK